MATATVMKDPIKSLPGGKKMRNLVIDWSEVKHKVLRMLTDDNEKWPTQAPMESKLITHRNNPERVDRWEGGSGIQMCNWIRNGFRAKEFVHSAEIVHVANKKRAVWDEDEGEIDVGRLIDGKEDYFFNRGEREKRPGLRLQIEFAFSCAVPNKVISEYGAWVAGLIGSLEQSGFSLEVDLMIPLDDLYQGDRNTRTNVFVRVKRHNEVSDFTEWSSLFSPIGYRTLGFAAKCIAGDKIGKKITYSFGHCVTNRTWDLNYDKNSQTVTVSVDQLGHRPLVTSALTEKAVEAGLIPPVVKQ